MALSLDAHVVQDYHQYVDVRLDFVGTIAADATSVQECKTSSGWSECVVNAYHVCAQNGGSTPFMNWWKYSMCMYRNQYPPEGSTTTHYLECAGMNPVHPLLRNQSCSKEDFPGIVETISNKCAALAGVDAGQVQSCATGATGVELLKQSMNASYHFPLSVMLKVEPQWMMVGGPAACSEEEGGWNACKPFFDKTACEDWNHCSSDDWALHLRGRVCNSSGISPCN